MEVNIEKILDKTFESEYLPSGRESVWFKNKMETEGEFFCNECLHSRNMKVQNIKMCGDTNVYKNKSKAIKESLPLIYKLECLQCKSKAYLIVYVNNNKTTSIILSEKIGGCPSKNAPEGVKHYLNEAYLSKTIGAQSASMSMYRAALDFLLHEQGYTNGMLGKKIEKLEEDILKKIAPKWAMEVELDYLKVIKEIGNSSIHPNDGDISRQKEIDEKLLNIVDIVFSELLEKIYEQPVRSKNNLDILKTKIEKINKKE